MSDFHTMARLRIKAGALFFALAISMVIGLIIGSVLILEQSNRALLQQDKIREEVARNSFSGIQLLYATNETFQEGKTMDLYGRGKDSVFIKTIPWGAYDVLISRAVTGGQVHEEILIAGAEPDSNSAYALWLADLDRPLFITGSTRLTGRCFLPEAGIERAYVEGKSYSGNQLVYGAVQSSSRFVPEYNAGRIALLEQRLKQETFSCDSFVTWEELSGMDSVVQSFANKTMVIREQGPLTLENVYLNGNIILQSGTGIRITASAQLNNVLVFAPKIIIDKNVAGQFQSVASDSVIVSDDVQLDYPSSLIVCSKSSAKINCAIITGENFKLSGTVFCNRTSNDLQIHSLISLGNKCTITGEVYCSEEVELKGSVYGSLTCSVLYLRTNSAVYQNHLVDAVINRSEFPAEYAFGLLARNSFHKKKPIEWQ